MLVWENATYSLFGYYKPNNENKYFTHSIKLCISRSLQKTHQVFGLHHTENNGTFLCDNFLSKTCVNLKLLLKIVILSVINIPYIFKNYKKKNLN